MSSFTPDTDVEVYLSDGSPIPENNGRYNFTQNANAMAIRIIDFALNNVNIHGNMVNPVNGKVIPNGRGGFTADLWWPYLQLRREFASGVVGQGPLNMPFQGISLINVLNILQNPLATLNDLFNYYESTINPVNSVFFRTWFTSVQLGKGSVHNRHQYAVLGATGREVLPESITMRMAEEKDWEPFYQLLFNTIRVRSKEQHLDAYNHLDAAPCEGISLGKGKPEAMGWRASSRYIKGQGDQNYGQDDGHHGKLTGNFNGLDYMLLHNLFYMSSDAYWLMREYRYGLNSDINGELSGVGYNTVFNKIKSRASLLPSSVVLMRAGVSVSLEPGFNTEAGAQFEALVDPFECYPTTYNRMRGEDPLKKDENNKELISVETNNQVKVYPNPVANNLNIEFKGCIDCSYDIVLTDLNGKLIEEFNDFNEKKFQMDTEKLINGIYLLRIVDRNNGENYMHKVVKSN